MRKQSAGIVGMIYENVIIKTNSVKKEVRSKGVLHKKYEL